MRKYKVAVIGACGHVGLPYAIINALAGNKVIGFDINEKYIEDCNAGKFPYVEDQGQEGLTQALLHGNLQFTSDMSRLSECNVLAIMIGTPVDSENNPRIDDIMEFVDRYLYHFVRHHDEEPLILLRSTVAPGTTDLIRSRLEEWGCQNSCHLAFCPERVAQGKSLVETSNLPQLIGTYNNDSYEAVADYFKTFNHKESHYLTAREAEVAKLATNMYRYVNFAFANELYMIADKQGVNINKVIEAANKDYPRLNIPTPGPNVGGPCLFKDGRFLLENIPFVELIQTAFIINEGMPQYVFNRMMDANPKIRHVYIFGMTFKADSDDTRNSLSFKFKKICERHGLDVSYSDPYYGNSGDSSPEHADAYVIMTPHKEYHSMFDNMITSPPKGTVLVDVWKVGGEVTKNSSNGIVIT